MRFHSEGAEKSNVASGNALATGKLKLVTQVVVKF
jgi:hypothetical protein